MKKFVIKLSIIGTVIVTLFIFHGCTANQTKMAMNADNGIKNAICVLQPTAGNDVNGIVKFTKEDNGIRVIADIHNLTPGKHGFHVHEFGDISANDGTSTGGHFNPDGKKHGAPTDAERHVGDLGNVVADSSGNAHLDWLDHQITFYGPHSIIGRGMIVHQGEDDLITQPTGNAGKRVAFGVIGIAKSE